jgi:hypothetical protein
LDKRQLTAARRVRFGVKHNADIEGAERLLVRGDGVTGGTTAANCTNGAGDDSVTPPSKSCRS